MLLSVMFQVKCVPGTRASVSATRFDGGMARFHYVQYSLWAQTYLHQRTSSVVRNPIHALHRGSTEHHWAVIGQRSQVEAGRQILTASDAEFGIAPVQMAFHCPGGERQLLSD